MSRALTNSDKLMIGQAYGYTTSCNQFVVIGLYEQHAWVLWQSGGCELDTIHLTPINTRSIIVLA